MGRKELRIGVIGAGGRGGLARHAHCPDDGVRLTAACDVNPKSLQSFKEKYGPDVFLTNDYRKLVDRDDLDAVFVTSPDFLHEEQTIAALETGKSVYVEKPMAIAIAGCDRMLKTAMKHKAKLYVGHNMRHMAFTHKMKELIDKGAIGEVKAGWCRHFVCYGGDASWSLDNWPPLNQKGLNPVIDVEDVSMMLMTLDNGVLASYQQCHFTPDGWRNYTIIGTEGRIENFGDSPGECVVRLWDKKNYYQPYGDKQFFIPRESGSHGGADPRIVNEFVRYIRGETRIRTSAIAARYSVAAGCSAAQSLRRGSMPVSVPALPKHVADYFNRDVIR